MLSVTSINACIHHTNWDIPWYSLAWPSSRQETPPVEIWSTEYTCSSAKRGLSTRTWKKPWKTSWLLQAECQRPRRTNNIMSEQKVLIRTVRVHKIQPDACWFIRKMWETATKNDIYCIELWDCQLEWSQKSFHWIFKYLRKSQTVILLKLF